MNKPYDPVLRQAAREINAVMKKHDICGFFSLHSMTNGEFAMNIDATWSLMEYNTLPNGDIGLKIKVRHKLPEQMDATGGLIFGMRDMAAMFFQQADLMAKKLQEHCAVDHKPFGGGINNLDRDGAN